MLKLSSADDKLSSADDTVADAAFAAFVLFHRSDNAIKNHWHSIAKIKQSTEHVVTFDIPAFSVSESALSCTPSQNGGLVGVQPVRLFNTPKTVSDIICYMFFLSLCSLILHVVQNIAIQQ